jgi:two-component system chemotaxis response regulator CheY
MAEDDHVLEFNGNYNALVVDDSAFMVKNLVRMLESFGAEVLETAENGVEAVEAVDEHGDDLDFITLDITMPEKNGIEALEEILDMYPDMKVCMVSAMGQEDTVKKCVMKGAKHFIVKPFERDDVFEKLTEVLGD